MKIKSLFAGLLLSAVAANASVTISGTSLFNAEINGYSTGVYVVSDSASFTESLMEDLVAGISFTQYTAIGDYTVIGTAPINLAGTSGSSALTAGITFNLGGNIATGNEIGILAFNTSTTSTVAGDAYKLFTNDWLVQADSANLSLTGGGPFTGASVLTVPEPSAYPMLAGLIALGCVMLRRRA